MPTQFPRPATYPRFPWRTLLLGVGLWTATLGSQSAALPFPVGTEFQVNTFTPSLQNEPTVIGDSQGGYLVFWVSALQDGDFGGIFGQRLDADGTKLGSEFQVNAVATGDQRKPRAAADPFGNFVVAWEKSDDVFARLFDSGGVPLTGDLPVNLTTAFVQDDPDVWMTPAGEFIVAWHSTFQDSDSGGIFLRKFSSTGVPLTGEIQVNTEVVGGQQSPSISGDLQGSFVVTWSSEGQDGDGFGIFGQCFDAAPVPGFAGSEFQINDFTTGDQIFGETATHPAGGHLTAWVSQDQDGDAGGIFGRAFECPGQLISAEVQINTTTAFDQRAISVAASDNFVSFVVVWHSLDAQGGLSVLGQMLGFNGSLLDDEFEVAPAVPGSESNPGVAFSNYPRFLVVWESFGAQGGDSEGVYGQLFVADIIQGILDVPGPGILGLGALALLLVFGGLYRLAR